ncbi:hypothetical protein HGM15179_006575 [Zosterops borbonicus]|uniref:Uncharacterized protein n=1 Tax=Zosterops borbonicus TaxID=364589 RepID=A0A8K1GM80_9PASS|nr:hypothetical protein HGM15179_006575 [Zosterops borbonicus]
MAGPDPWKLIWSNPPGPAGPPGAQTDVNIPKEEDSTTSLGNCQFLVILMSNKCPSCLGCRHRAVPPVSASKCPPQVEKIPTPSPGMYRRWRGDAADPQELLQSPSLKGPFLSQQDTEVENRYLQHAHPISGSNDVQLRQEIQLSQGKVEEERSN